MAAYLTGLADVHRLSVATIRLHRFAIGAAHRSAGLDDPTAHEGVRRVLAGLARANARPQRQARALTAGALAAIRATARIPRRSQGRAGRLETSGAAERRGLVDIALASTLRDGLLRRSEAAALRWGDVELLADGSGRLQVRQSKGDQEGEGAVLYLGPDAVRDLRAIRPAEGLTDARAPVFGLSRQPGRAAPAGGGAGGGSRRWVHRPLRPGGDGPGPGGDGSRAAGADDGGPVEDLGDGGPVHGGPERRERGGGPVLRAPQRGGAPGPPFSVKQDA